MRHTDRESDGRDSGPEEMKDPMSGYASADALDPQAAVDREPGGREDDGNLKDPMSGYASGDAMDPESEGNRPRNGEAAEETQDPMSGYASADALEPGPESSGDKSGGKR